jgi:hypothetical protein
LVVSLGQSTKHNFDLAATSLSSYLSFCFDVQRHKKY